MALVWDIHLDELNYFRQARIFSFTPDGHTEVQTPSSKRGDITINIDGDESDDFRLENIDYHSATHGSSIVRYVLALHDSAQLLVESFIDTGYILEKRDNSSLLLRPFEAL